MKYEYKKVKGYDQKKFIENGHTMFEEDVLQRLKRLAYLEEQLKQAKNIAYEPVSATILDNPNTVEGGDLGVFRGDDKIPLRTGASTDELITGLRIDMGDYFINKALGDLPEAVKLSPLTGELLEILNKTYNRLLSEEPTRL